MEEIKTEEFVVSDADHKRILHGIHEITNDKVRFFEFLKFKKARSAELDAAYKAAMADLAKKEEELLSEIEKKEERFRTIYDTIFNDVVPDGGPDRNDMTYNDLKKAFVKKSSIPLSVVREVEGEKKEQ